MKRTRSIKVGWLAALALLLLAGCGHQAAPAPTHVAAMTTLKADVLALFRDRQYALPAAHLSEQAVTKAERRYKQVYRVRGDLTAAQKQQLTLSRKRLATAKQFMTTNTEIDRVLGAEQVITDATYSDRALQRTFARLQQDHAAFARSIKSRVALIGQQVQAIGLVTTATTGAPDMTKIDAATRAVQAVAVPAFHTVYLAKLPKVAADGTVTQADGTKVAVAHPTPAQQAVAKAQAEAARVAAAKAAAAKAEAAKAAAAKAQAAKASTAPAAASSQPAAASGLSGVAAYVAASPSARSASQIVATVASGSSATVYLFEKAGGTWQEVLRTAGRVGRNGVGNAYEGSKRTPVGSYPLTMAFGTGGNPGAGLPYRQITNQSYYISNTADPQYNTWQERATSSPKDEHMLSYATAYQYGIVIGYNHGVGGGSAFFLHCNWGSTTAGCVSVPAGTMLQLVRRLRAGARIINVTSAAQLAQY